MIRLLLDEAICAPLDEVRQGDVDAVHVRSFGLGAATDRDVLACAWAEHRLLVTANVTHSARLARARPHRGIVFLEEMIFPPVSQVVHITAAIEVLRAALAEGQVTENQILRVWDRSMWEWRGGRPCFADPDRAASTVEMLSDCSDSALASEPRRLDSAPGTTITSVLGCVDVASENTAGAETEPLENLAARSGSRSHS